MSFLTTKMSYKRLGSLEHHDTRLQNGSKLTRKIKSLRRWHFVIVGISLLLVTGSLGIIHHRLVRLASAEFDFIPPLIPRPVPVAEFRSRLGSPPTTLEELRIEVSSRLESIGLSSSKLGCKFDEEDKSRYQELRNNGKILIALNLYNSESILQSLASNLLTLADFLGDVTNSIYENGSTDRTSDALSHLATVLSLANIIHSVRMEVQGTDWSAVHRIEQLAKYRNEAISPLFDPAFTATPFDTVLFINDIFCCPVDALELLLQRRIQNADAVCGLEWIPGSLLRYFGFGTLKSYDNCESVLTLPTSEIFNPLF